MAQLPSHLPPKNPRAQLRLPRRRLLPASPAEAERFWADCSRTTSSASQSIHRQSRFAPMAAEAPQPCPLHSPKSRVHCRRQFLLPASREEAARPRLRAPKARPLCLNVQSTEVEAQLRRRDSTRAVQHPAIPATPMMEAARPPKHSPRPDFRALATFLPTMAAVPLHSVLPDLAACGRLQLPARPREARRFRLAAILLVPWSVQSRLAEAPLRS